MADLLSSTVWESLGDLADKEEPVEEVSGISHWVETPGKTQNLLDRLYLTISFGILEELLKSVASHHDAIRRS